MRDSNAYLKKSDTFGEKVPNSNKVDSRKSNRNKSTEDLKQPPQVSREIDETSDTIATVMRISDTQLRFFCLSLSGRAIVTTASRLALTLTLAVMFLTRVPSPAQETLPPSYQADDEILFKLKEVEGCGTDSHGRCFQSCRTIVLRGVTKRVVGRGLVSEGDQDAQGKLTNSASYVSAKVLGQWASLEFDTMNGVGDDGSGIPKLNTSDIYVNGVKVDSIVIVYSPSSPEFGKYHVKFPAGLLRFARRNPGSAGAPGPGPTPGENEIRIETRNTSPLPRECGDHAGYHFGIRLKRDGQVHDQIMAARVRFEAMAPIVMVHGISSSAGWFEGMQPGFRFPFDQVRAPVYVAPQYEADEDKRHGYLSLGNGRIASEVSNRLIRELSHAAKEFGSDNVHVIAHSKGGLWSRYAISQLKVKEADPTETAPGVYSLTTLDTPHHGSVLADFSNYSIAHWRKVCSPLIPLFGGAAPVIPRSKTEWLLCGARFRNGPSDIDLGPDALAKFNKGSKLPENFHVRGREFVPFYRTVGSDANLNHNLEGPGESEGLGIIEVPSETAGWGWKEAPFCPTLYWALQKHRVIRWNPTTGQITSIVHNELPYPLNDFAVTVPSQFFMASENPEAQDADAFKPLGGVLGSPNQPLGRNHTSVGDDAIGRLVLDTFGPKLQKRTDPKE